MPTTTRRTRRAPQTATERCDLCDTLTPDDKLTCKAVRPSVWNTELTFEERREFAREDMRPMTGHVEGSADVMSMQCVGQFCPECAVEVGAC